ncbi:hypothetical protein BDP55DRAFT_625761 [Colletotrichum godetiae]|uniref:Uncharacterized protein n=1 Tax=Colletotrichum godetiae TaxID=1209918 RepID=A0AAJ0B0E8_9PEZI|nr:uncharacterized protein BDP55DRAFT_625761 [Colletotrichum godetiae]KAK1701555.1 hypothetical protein BDP55DRAFT_625761 [Colletotrichum godetiae]
MVQTLDITRPRPRLALMGHWGLLKGEARPTTFALLDRFFDWQGKSDGAYREPVEESSSLLTQGVRTFRVGKVWSGQTAITLTVDIARLGDGYMSLDLIRTFPYLQRRPVMPACLHCACAVAVQSMSSHRKPPGQSLHRVKTAEVHNAKRCQVPTTGKAPSTGHSLSSQHSLAKEHGGGGLGTNGAEHQGPAAEWAILKCLLFSDGTNAPVPALEVEEQRSNSPNRPITKLAIVVRGRFMLLLLWERYENPPQTPSSSTLSRALLDANPITGSFTDHSLLTRVSGHSTNPYSGSIRRAALFDRLEPPAMAFRRDWLSSCKARRVLYGALA